MNPAACAGANVVLDKMDEAFLADVRKKADYLRGELMKIDEVESLSGLGMMIGVNFKTKDYTQVVQELCENGVLAITTHGRLRLLPPLTITKEEMDQALQVFRKVLG